MKAREGAMVGIGVVLSILILPWIIEILGHYVSWVFEFIGG